MEKIKIIITAIIGLMLIGSAAFAQQETPPYPTGFWIVGQLSGPPALTDLSGFRVVFYKNTGDHGAAYASATTESDGSFRINAMDDLRMLPLEARTYYIGVVRREVGGVYYGKNETSVAVIAADLGNGYKDLTTTLALAVGEGIGATRGGPLIDLTVLLEGYADANVDPPTQRPASVEVELRTGVILNPSGIGNNPGTVVTAVPYVLTDSNNTRVVDGVGTTVVDGPYYVVIKHLNHLPVIISTPVTLTLATVSRIDLSDPAALLTEYQPTSMTNTAMILNSAATKKLMRGGEYFTDGLITIDDWDRWRDAYGSDPRSSNWNPQADGNGDGLVTVDDWDIWRDNYGSRTYVP